MCIRDRVLPTTMVSTPTTAPSLPTTSGPRYTSISGSTRTPPSRTTTAGRSSSCLSANRSPSCFESSHSIWLGSGSHVRTVSWSSARRSGSRITRAGVSVRGVAFVETSLQQKYFLTGGQKVVGSNPIAPTTKTPARQRVVQGSLF